MRINRKLLLVAGMSFIAVVAVQRSAMATETSAWATPEGITLQPLGKAQGYDLGKQTAAFLAREKITYADAKGMTLYTYKMDPPGKSVCVGECGEYWLPLVASSNARAYGDWSVITREDGTRQWAFRTKPLYTFLNDVDPGSVGGNSPARFGSRRIDGSGRVVGGGNRGSGLKLKKATTDVPLPDEWKPALVYPVSGIEAPYGISIREVADANAIVLINHDDRTLYALHGDPAGDRQADGTWLPAAAPLFAKPVGDFAFVVRADGIKQWTYKGKGLYTYAYDFAPGDAYGIGQDENWDVAAVVRYYIPPDVSIQHTPGQGKILATTEGMTLYRRDGHILQSGGGRSLRRGNPARPAVGRDIGTDARCDEDCRKMWHPFTAPDNARPRDFWDVAVRADGSKQWVYQGYALWIYGGDKKLGDMNGNDSYLFAFADLPNMRSDAPKPEFNFGTWMDGAPALYWVITVP
jgi:predicted lipoprotein with Yx(FWY)xxD motif